MPATKLDTFTTAYIECALWSSTDDNDDPMDDNFTIDDIAPASLEKMIADCQAFQKENKDRIVHDLVRAGHDFWLTRNGHGAGFWDGDWDKRDGEILTYESKRFGTCDLMVGDDGEIYCS